MDDGLQRYLGRVDSSGDWDLEIGDSFLLCTSSIQYSTRLPDRDATARTGLYGSC